MNHNYVWLKRGDWCKWSRKILIVEYRTFGKGERTERGIFREFINDWEPFTLIVTEKNDPNNVIAYFMCCDLELAGDDLKKDDKNFGKANTLYLFSIATLPKWRGQGIGSVMMRKLIDGAKTRPSMIGKKYARISLHTRSPQFEKLAKRFGFKKVKTVLLEGHKNSYMVLEL